MPVSGVDSRFATRGAGEVSGKAELGHELRRPEADYLRDGVYELRARVQGVNHRILYFFHGRVACVVSHGLVKERVVPPGEIDRAVERMCLFADDPKKHTFEEK